jgi:hypothetical protein
MAVTLTELRQQALTLLDQARDSTVGALESGPNDTPTVTADANLDAFLNEGAQVLAKTCMPLYGEGTIAAWTIGDRRARLHEATVAAGGTLWSARSVRYGTTTLRYCDRSKLETRARDFESTANRAPIYWSRFSEDEILIWPPPDTSATLTIAGLITGPALVDHVSNTAAPFMPDAAVRWLPRYAAKMLAVKGKRNPALAEFAAIWGAEWDEERQRRWEALDPNMRRFHYPTAPLALAGK